jgi:hypothetical protein
MAYKAQTNFVPVISMKSCITKKYFITQSTAPITYVTLTICNLLVLTAEQLENKSEIEINIFNYHIFHLCGRAINITFSID